MGLFGFGLRLCQGLGLKARGSYEQGCAACQVFGLEVCDMDMLGLPVYEPEVTDITLLHGRWYGLLRWVLHIVWDA